MDVPIDFDLIVLGTGSAGSHVAEACRKAGWRVAIIEARQFGGTCALRGCEPKKVLWTLAEAADRARRLAPVGLVDGAALTIDWAALQSFKRTFTDPVPEKTEQHFRALGIEARRGAARFVARDMIEVEGRRLRARHFLIATGARPVPLPIDGRELLATSDDFLALERLPARLVLVGGGYVAFEIAHIARRGGAAVTILHDDDRPLAGFDRQLVWQLVGESRRAGIVIELGARVEHIERAGRALRVFAEGGRAVETDLVVHAAGRGPDLDGLALDAAGIERDGARLRLDRHLRSTSNPQVFAAGDAAAAGPPLTPVATIDAETVTRNLLDRCRHEPDYRGVPSVVFSIPPLTRVGLGEEQARGQGLDFTVNEADMAGYQSVRRLRHAAAAYRVLVERGSGRLLGAHLLGPGAAETINLFALAIRLDLGTAGLRRLVSSYPTFGSNVVGMLE